MTTTALLSVTNVHSGYDMIPVLHGISCELSQGEIVGLLGHNGMGKSTFLKTLTGLLPTTSGTIELNHLDITALPAHARARLGLGYVPQGRGIFPSLSVRENLRFAWHRQLGVSEDQALKDALRDFPRLEPLLERTGNALSGGEQQILALARCLLARPRVLLLDEPTEGIQPSIIEEIEALLVATCKDQGIGIMVVEQNVDFLSVLCERVLILERGVITAELSAEQLTENKAIEAFAGLSSAV